jgi:SAM-dependent methyltransferase
LPTEDKRTVAENPPCPTPTGFDEYAANYDAALAQGLSVSGEDKTFFARGRIEWLAGCLRELKAAPRTVLDFGCGTGSAAPLLIELLKAESVTGVDVSAQSLELARKAHGSERCRFLLHTDYRPNGEADLAFCNGVFHHIPSQERAAAVEFVFRAVRPGGWFALWENNPWNPGTRYVMSRIPFDREAVLLWPGQTRRLLEAGGFEARRTDFLFIFPRPLRWLRWIEPHVSRLPLGAQYQVLGRKPA